MSTVVAWRQFFEQATTELPKASVVCFAGEGAYPVLFFSRVMSGLKRRHQSLFQTIDLADKSRQQALTMLETSFLGTSSVYWLRDLSALSTQEQSFWLSYCAAYKGPHTIWFFVSGDKKGNHHYPVEIAIPDQCSANSCNHLAPLLAIGLTFQHKIYLKKIFEHQESISLDASCLLLEYIALLGPEADQFFTQLLPQLLPSETSLFALSSAFLSKKSAQFYPLWKQVGSRYSEQFWCSFFADLLWRGAQYIRLAHEQNMVAARAMTYGLPFSFTKTDWRMISHKELVAAHQAIYAADFALKNSSGQASLDLFFSSFFLNTFA